MTEVEDFIYQFEGSQRALLLYFHNLLCNELELTSKIRFKIPFYDRKTWICYTNPTKTGGVDFALVRGNELSNAQGLLEQRGRKQIYSVEFKTIQDIPEDTLYEVLQEALLLDETTPYTVRKNRK